MLYTYWRFIFVGGCIALIVVIFYVIFKIIRARYHDEVHPAVFLLKYYRTPVVSLVMLLSGSAVLPLLNLPAPVVDVIGHLLSIGVLGCLTWLCVRLVTGIEHFVLRKYDIAEQDNLQARKIHTQLRVIKRVVIVIYVLSVWQPCL